MNGFTMTGGYNTGYGILKVESGIATFENMEFSNNGGNYNSNLFDGSGIDQTFFIDCVFKNNIGDNKVGVLWSTAIRCLFYDNYGSNDPSPLCESKAINCVVYNTTGCGGGASPGVSCGWNDFSQCKGDISVYDTPHRSYRSVAPHQTEKCRLGGYLAGNDPRWCRRYRRGNSGQLIGCTSTPQTVRGLCCFRSSTPAGQTQFFIRTK